MINNDDDNNINPRIKLPLNLCVRYGTYYNSLTSTDIYIYIYKQCAKINKPINFGNSKFLNIS